MTGGVTHLKHTVHVKKALGLTLMSDLHIGNGCLDEARLRADIAEGRRREDRFLFNGDLFEALPTSDPRYLPSSTRRPSDAALNDALDAATDLLKPIRKRIDLLGSGNHDYRLMRNANFDVVDELAHRLRRHDIAGGYANFITYDIHFTNGCRRQFVIFAHHGAKGGRSSLLNNYTWVAADVVWVGHHHHRVSTGCLTLHPDGLREQRRVMTGAYLNAYAPAKGRGLRDNYASIAGYSPGLPGGCRVIITPTEVSVVQ